MIEFDSSQYKNKINESKLNKILKNKDEINAKLNSYYMTGWMQEIPSELMDDINAAKKQVKDISRCLVVVGIGGSYLGSLALNSIFTSDFKNKFEVYYVGNSLSTEYVEDLLEHLDKKDFCINVISKSGNTTETLVLYNIIKKFMSKKYSKAEMKKRIIITTNKNDGKLLEEAKKNGYTHLQVPDSIGGRYSLMSAAHLFPLSFNIDIDELKEGYYNGKCYNDLALEYAACRYLLFKKNKVVENYICNNPKFLNLLEWLKQLFAESEGKNGKGILPVSMLFTRDLHSLGQYIQEGNKILFETFIETKNSGYLEYNGKDLHEINNNACKSALRAHNKGSVPTGIISIEENTEYNLGELMYFFMMAASYSSILFGVNPFDQPGVEVYKKEIKESNVF